MSNDQALRDHLLFLIKGEGAHAGFDDVVNDFPPALRGKKPNGVAHSSWQLLEHLRIAQSDILEYTRTPGHVSAEFPAGYWPASETPPSDDGWAKSAEAFRADVAALGELVTDESSDLLAPLAHAKGTSIMGQVLLAADHNAYHLGQLVMLRRLLGAW